MLPVEKVDQMLLTITTVGVTWSSVDDTSTSGWTYIADTTATTTSQHTDILQFCAAQNYDSSSGKIYFLSLQLPQQ